LVRAYAASLDERYAEGFWRLIEDWAAQNPPNRGVNWASGQEAAVRLMAWCFALYTFFECQSSTSQRVFQLVRMIEKHGERIAGFIEYALSQRNNHGISEAVGLFTIGTLFPQLRRAAEWRVRGQELIIRQLREQVYNDGSYVQHSFNYQRVLIDNLLWSFRLGELNGYRFPDESYKIFERAVAFMLRFCDSHTGKMPNFGSNDGSLILPLSRCDYLDFRPSLQAAHYLLHHRPYFADGPWNETTEWICAASKDRDVVCPERIEAADRDATCRVSTDTDSSVRRSGYLKLQGSESSAMLRAAHFVDRPAQADQLHLDLWWRGENIACDAGTYLYNGGEPWTNAFAVTAVHNSVAVGHRDQMTRAGRFLWLDWAQAECSRYRVGKLGTAVEAWHDGYRNLGIVHKRAVLNIEDCWMIVDDLTGTFAGEARLHWLFPDYEFAWEQDECRLWMQTPAGPFQCCLHAPRDGSVSLVRAGKVLAGAGNNDSTAELEVRGWRSLYYGEKKPALSVAAECQAPTRFITVLAPAEIVLTSMDEAGIRLRLGQREFVVGLNSRDAAHIFSAPQ
jgi:asparagine synthase (glutamine-hydrolysing)